MRDAGAVSSFDARWLAKQANQQEAGERELVAIHLDESDRDEERLERIELGRSSSVNVLQQCRPTRRLPVQPVQPSERTRGRLFEAKARRGGGEVEARP